MTLLAHTYAIRNLLSKGIASKDTQYSLRLLAHFMDVARAILTEQKADKYRFISELSFQSLCVPLEKGHFHNCCDYPTAGCVLLKSKEKLPKFLTTRWGDFAKVLTLSGENISKTSIVANKFSKYSLTNNPAKTGWFIHDGYLYVINGKSLEVALFNSLFDSPAEVEQLNCSQNVDEECKDIFDTEYPVDADLVEPMYKKVLDLIRYSQQFPPKDKENDATDNQVSS